MAQAVEAKGNLRSCSGELTAFAWRQAGRRSGLDYANDMLVPTRKQSAKSGDLVCHLISAEAKEGEGSSALLGLAA